jgi:hypothetical protein
MVVSKELFNKAENFLRGIVFAQQGDSLCAARGLSLRIKGIIFAQQGGYLCALRGLSLLSKGVIFAH